jgi:hypothetical protein
LIDSFFWSLFRFWTTIVEHSGVKKLDLWLHSKVFLLTLQPQNTG